MLFRSVDRDGTKQGLNWRLWHLIADNVPVPVILSGGCGSVAHFVEGFINGGAAAIAAGTFFCFCDQNLMQVRAQIRNAGIPMRMEI